MFQWEAKEVVHIDGLVQDCSNSSALAMGLLQSYTKPTVWCGYGQYQVSIV